MFDIKISRRDIVEVAKCIVLAVVGYKVLINPNDYFFLYMLVLYAGWFFADALYVLFKGDFRRYGKYTASSAIVYASRLAICIAVSVSDRDMIAMMLITSLIVDIVMHRNASRVDQSQVV
jgi:hypothetical protein